MQLSQPRGLRNEVLLQGVFLEGQIAMLEGAKRRASMCQAYYRTSYIRARYIVPVRSNFPVPKGHNANFAWNQDEVPQNSRYAKRFYYSR